MKSLYYSYNMTVDCVYIIRLNNNSTSEKLAKRCAESCNKINQKWVFWDAYDGIDQEIKIPSHHNVVMELIKITDHYATRGEVATALSHISLWVECVKIDKPIVILEHDAIMVQPYYEHKLFNSIAYLGCCEQVLQSWPVLPTPIHASEGPNYHFICRAHAYAIDPIVAKNLLSHVIKYGIYAPLDIMIRADIFPMHQMGIVAFDEVDPALTTILNRPKEGRTTKRNDDLSL